VTETLLFFKEFFQNGQAVGGIRPSSKKLAIEMASLINFNGPKRILEIGPGTGIITEEIIKRLGKDDSLTLVEINPQFARLLNEKKKEWIQKEDAPSIEILNMDFLIYKSDKQFDVVIAGVPFNNFPLEVLKGFIKKIKSLSKNFTYFEYMAARKIKGLFEDKEISEFFKKEVHPFTQKDKKILLNVPPAKIRFIRF
jgi:phospholipid N-methyltransferase